MEITAIQNILSTLSIIFMCLTLLTVVHQTQYDGRKAIYGCTIFVLALNAVNLIMQISSICQ